MSLRAAIYARVSSIKQRDNHTIENQLRVLPAYVTSQGWQLAGTYVDDGRSVKTGSTDPRDGFDALIRDAHAKKFEVVVVVAIDRLTRTEDLLEQAQVLAPFQRLGIDIVTPSGGRLDLRTMFGRMWTVMQAMVAAEDNRLRAEKIMAGKLRAIAEGRKPAGPTPYGFRYDRATGAWSIDEAAAELVREIFRRVAGGETCVAIADDLARRDARPSPTRTREGWSRAAVYRIVRKRSAIGEYEADKARGAVLKIPAILTEHEWKEAQRALLRHRRRGLLRTRHVYLLEGIAKCGECGGRIDIRSAANVRSKPNQPAYVCRNRKLGKCGAMIVKTPDLDERVWTALCAELEQPGLLQALAEVDAARAGDVHDWMSDILTHRKHLARLERVEIEIMARYRRDLITQGALDAELEALNRERKAVRNQLATAERAVGANITAQERVAAATATIESLRSALPQATPAQRQALLRELAHDGGVVIVRGRARLDLQLLRAAVPSQAAEPRIALVVSPV